MSSTNSAKSRRRWSGDVGPAQPQEHADLRALLGAEVSLSLDAQSLDGLFRAPYHMVAARTADGIVGCGVFRIAADEAELVDLLVAPDHRGEGIGECLLLGVLEQARNAGATMMYLEVRSSNTVAINLYETRGFATYSTRSGYYPGPKGREDALCMCRNLSDSVAL